MRIILSLSRQNTVSFHLTGGNIMRTKYYKEKNHWERMITLRSFCLICFIMLSSAAIDKTTTII